MSRITPTDDPGRALGVRKPQAHTLFGEMLDENITTKTQLSETTADETMAGLGWNPEWAGTWSNGPYRPSTTDSFSASGGISSAGWSTPQNIPLSSAETLSLFPDPSIATVPGGFTSPMGSIWNGSFLPQLMGFPNCNTTLNFGVPEIVPAPGPFSSGPVTPFLDTSFCDTAHPKTGSTPQTGLPAGSFPLFNHADPRQPNVPNTSKSGDQHLTTTREWLENPETEMELACFGMLAGIPGTCELPRAETSSPLSGRLVTKLETPESFIGKQGDLTILSGKILPDWVYLTMALLEEENLQLQVSCAVAPENPPKVLGNGKRLRPSGPAVIKCSIDIILYGPRYLFDVVGEFIDKCNENLQDDRKLYLQDPVDCDKNVRYCNPHRLPSLDSTQERFTFTLAEKRQEPLDVEETEPRPELLELLESQEDLPEARQPPTIKTLLERHQRQALTFMLRREQGWEFSGTRPDIWEAVEDGQGHCFVNRVSDIRQAEEPPAFYGGIIADPMGFGKTLSMIALIASDSTHISASDDGGEQLGIPGEDFSRPTLVIVPPALLGTWEHELETHVTPSSLPWRLHHGKMRLTKVSELELTALVLTTYHTVSIEGRTENSRQSSILFSTRWRRVVLDEAHFVRNSESQMARAVCSLNAVSRWAVTGTPIQNHISDLAALLKFLVVYPYNEKRVFEADISQPWKSGNAEEAVKRLRRLAGCLVLRRPRRVVQLPPRHDHGIHVDFHPTERQLYTEVRMRAIQRLNDMESLQQGGNHDGMRPPSLSFVNVLQQIEAMRMVCNLGLLYPTRHNANERAASKRTTALDDWSEIAQCTFNLRLGLGTVQCHHCSFVLNSAAVPSEDEESTRSLFSQCLRFICSGCVHGSNISGGVNNLDCGHIPPCPIVSVSSDTQSPEESIPIPIASDGRITTRYLPTKVNALIQDLQALERNVKCVVFSNWRMTLNVVKAGLDQAKISSLRFDGQVPHRDRQGVLERFRNDPSVRVLLLTLSCGAVGLTLTNATRAYLMEPHWNPTVEDQALARIHRIGQKQEVTTVRLYIRNSFEENVVTNQESKRALASILLAPSGTAAPGDSDYLNHLRALI